MATMDPTGSWASFGTLDHNSSHAKNIEQLLLTADFNYLRIQALKVSLT